jgi:Fe2+ transport system protein B
LNKEIRMETETSNQNQSQPDNFNGAFSTEPVETQETAPVVNESRKVKINGEELEVPIEDIKRHLGITDWDSKYEKQLIQAFQKSLAGDHAFNEVNRSKKEIEAAKAQLKYYNELLVGNPKVILQESGVDVRSMAFEILKEEYELEQMTPEQREAYEIKKQWEQDKTEKQELKDKFQKIQQEQEVSYHIENESQQLIDAISKTQLPKDINMLQMATVFMIAGQSAQEAVDTIQQKLPTWIDSWIQNATPEQIGKMLSKNARDKVQSYQIAQHKQKPTNQAPPPGTRIEEKPRQNAYGNDYASKKLEKTAAAFAAFESQRGF